MDRQEFNEGLLRAYQDERAAVVTLRHLQERGLSDEERDLAELFIRVETIVGDRLEPLVVRLGLPTGLDEDRLQRARARADFLGGWQAVVESLDKSLSHHVTRFQVLRAAAPPADREALDVLVDHEIALARFGALLREGKVEAARAALHPIAGDLGPIEQKLRPG